MDRKVYIWLYNHIGSYRFVNAEAIKLQYRLNALFEKEPNLETDAAYDEAKKIYEAFTEALYNNICGYEHGLANKGITCASLDGYFIETADGMVPIGYYKENRPVEAALSVQRYITQCEKDINEEKNQIVEGWQSRIDKVRVYYDALPKAKLFGVVKSTITLVTSSMLFLSLLVGFILSGGFGIWNVSGAQNKRELIARIQDRVGCLGRATEVDIKAFVVCVFIVMIIALGMIIFSALALRVAKKKSVTADLLAHAPAMIEAVEQGIQTAIQNNEETLHAAVRQGRSVEFTQNENATRIKELGQKLLTSESFVYCKKIYVHISVVFVVIGLLGLTSVIYTNWIPMLEDYNTYTKAVRLMEKDLYSDAEKLLEQLGDYKDAKKLWTECEYNLASDLMDQKQYKKAKEKLVSLKDYKDASELLKACNYQIAYDWWKSGELVEAFGLYKELGNYMDAAQKMEKMKPQLYGKGVTLYQDKRYYMAQLHFERSKDYGREADYNLLISAHMESLQDVSVLYPLIDFEDTKEILISDQYIEQFLLGHWSGSGKSLRYSKSSSGDLEVQHTLPGDISASCKLEDGKHFGNRYGYWSAQWDFEVVSADVIKVTCRSNDEEYTLRRN